MSEIISFEQIKESQNKYNEFIPVRGKTYIHSSKKEKSDIYFNKINQYPFTWDDVKETLGRQYKHVIESMLPLLVFITKQDKDGLAMISCKLFGKESKEIAQTDRNIRNLLKLDVIQCVSDFYSYDDGIAKVYNINWYRFDLFLGLIREDTNIWEKYNNIKDMYKNKYNDEINEIEDIRDNEEDNENEDVYFDSLDSKEDVLRNILKDLIKKQNKLQTKQIFKYSIGDGKGRPYCALCNYPTLEKHSRESKAKDCIFREDVLDSYFGEDTNIWEKYKEYDRSNSIYKINDYIRSKRIRDNDRNVDDIYLNLVNGKKEQRKYVKEMVMTLYFSDARKWRSTCEAFFEYYIRRNNAAQHKANKGHDRVWAVIQLLVLEGKSMSMSVNEWISLLVEWYKTTKEKLKKEVGDFVGKSIFLYEAIVNIGTEIDLLEKGYKCASVYDGFFTNASEEEWWDSYKKSLNKINNL